MSGDSITFFSAMGRDYLCLVTFSELGNYEMCMVYVYRVVCGLFQLAFKIICCIIDSMAVTKIMGKMQLGSQARLRASNSVNMVITSNAPLKLMYYIHENRVWHSYNNYSWHRIIGFVIHLMAGSDCTYCIQLDYIYGQRTDHLEHSHCLR